MCEQSHKVITVYSFIYILYIHHMYLYMFAQNEVYIFYLLFLSQGVVNFHMNYAININIVHLLT